MLKSLNSFNSYIKSDTKNNTKPNTKNNTEPDTKNNTESDTKNNIKSDVKNDTEWDINNTRASIRKNQISIKNKYKSLLETKKTIKNNIDSIYSALKKLPNESQPKLIELVRLDTILNDSINVVWHEIYERDKKIIKKIAVNKIKNVEGFICQLKGIVNHKILLLKTSVIVKLNLIISDIKNKLNINDIYNYNNKDKIFMILNNLDKYMKHLKRDIGSIKSNLKMISLYQTDSHKTLMGF